MKNSSRNVITMKTNFYKKSKNHAKDNDKNSTNEKNDCYHIMHHWSWKDQTTETTHLSTPLSLPNIVLHPPVVSSSPSAAASAATSKVSGEAKEDSVFFLSCPPPPPPLSPRLGFNNNMMPRHALRPQQQVQVQGITRKRRAFDNDGPLVQAGTVNGPPRHAFSASSFVDSTTTTSTITTTTQHSTNSGGGDCGAKTQKCMNGVGASCTTNSHIHDNHDHDDVYDHQDNGCGNTQGKWMLDRKCTPPTSPTLSSSPTTRRILTTSGFIAATTTSVIPTIQSTIVTSTTPIPFRTMTPPASQCMTSSASPFATSPYSKELSRFSNLTIQSPGSSFTAYSPHGGVKHQHQVCSSPSPCYNNSSNLGGLSSSLSSNTDNKFQAFLLQKQNPPRHVPIALVTGETMLHTNKKDGTSIIVPPRRNPLCDSISGSYGKGKSAVRPATPFLCLRNDNDDHYDHHHHHVDETCNKPTIPTVPDVSPQCHLSPQSSGGLSEDVHGKSSSSDGKRNEDTDVTSPPIAFLDMKPNQEHTAGRQKTSQTSTFTTSLLKQRSTDSLDDFFFSDDVSLGSSLTDSGDEGEWFFLCEPTMDASPTDCAHHWEAPRPSVLRQKLRRIPKLPFPPPPPTNNNAAPTGTDYITFSTRLLSKNVSTTKSQYSSSSSLFGLGIPQANSKASLNGESFTSHNWGSRKQLKTASFYALSQHESSSQSLQHLSAVSNAASSNSDLLSKTTPRDLVTPPVSAAFPESNDGPPPLKRSYHMNSSFFF